MAPARKRRRLPTLIDRGLGLLEVILPRGAQGDPVTALPAGQRDPGGFWFPAGYAQPGDIFTPAQRRLQAKQRQVQRVRHRKRDATPPIVPESGGTTVGGARPSRPQAHSGFRSNHPVVKPAAGESAQAISGLADRSLPLPPPALEAPGADVSQERGRMRIGMPPAAFAAPPRYPDSQPERAAAASVVVDSQKGSD